MPYRYRYDTRQLKKRSILIAYTLIEYVAQLIVCGEALLERPSSGLIFGRAEHGAVHLHASRVRTSQSNEDNHMMGQTLSRSLILPSCPLCVRASEVCTPKYTFPSFLLVLASVTNGSSFFSALC